MQVREHGGRPVSGDDDREPALRAVRGAAAAAASAGEVVSVVGQRLPFRGFRVGRLIVTTCRQASGAPLVDDAFIHDREGNDYVGKAVPLRPWLRNVYGERVGQRALTVGWRR